MPLSISQNLSTSLICTSGDTIIVPFFFSGLALGSSLVISRKSISPLVCLYSHSVYTLYVIYDYSNLYSPHTYFIVFSLLVWLEMAWVTILNTGIVKSVSSYVLLLNILLWYLYPFYTSGCVIRQKHSLLRAKGVNISIAKPLPS